MGADPHKPATRVFRLVVVRCQELEQLATRLDGPLRVMRELKPASRAVRRVGRVLLVIMPLVFVSLTVVLHVSVLLAATVALELHCSIIIPPKSQ
jgi:hypothetical protein